MKYLLVLSSILVMALHMVGQNPHVVDLTLIQDWESDRLYEEAERQYQDVTSGPSNRLQFAALGFERAKQEENDQKAARFSEYQGVVYTELGMYEAALEFSLQALEYAKRTPGTRDDIWSLYRLAEAHSILLNPEQALEDTREALRLSLERDTLIEVGWCYNEFGEIYRRVGVYDSAVHNYQQALAAFEAIAYVRGIKFVRQNLGLTYVAMEQYDLALAEFSRSDSIDYEMDVVGLLEEGDAMTKIIEVKHSRDSAIAFANEMASLAKRENYPRWYKDFTSQLADLYRKNGEWEKAWLYQREADSLEEVQTGERIRMQTRVADHQYRMQLLRTEHELQTQQNQNRILIWLSILLVLGAVGVVAMLQIAKNKRVRKINARLFAQNEHLDELIKEKDIWMNLMAHDLKSPLHSITGLLTMLKQESLPPAVKEKVLENIAKSVDKGTTLISQLLEISRLESSEVKTDIQTTNINELVLEIGIVFKAAAEQKGIALVTELPENLVELPTDPLHAQRILENFVSNALKFSPSGKQVRVVLESLPNHAAVHVIDEGPGISEAEQKNLFQKFKRLSARPTGGESSTGLGLSIVKQLAVRIQAEIVVRSTPGEGTTFSLLMPQNPTAS